MTTMTTPTWATLIDHLEAELEGLCRLLRLSSRQRRYLVHRQADRVHANVAAMDEVLATLRAANTDRRSTLAALGIATTGRKSLKDAAARADTNSRERIEALEAALARVTELLGRKNFQNYQLSRFSLDLVGEEMRLLLGASDGSGAAYDADGAAGDPALRGAVDGRA